MDHQPLARFRVIQSAGASTSGAILCDSMMAGPRATNKSRSPADATPGGIEKTLNFCRPGASGDANRRNSIYCPVRFG
jgi:hypothetical protein